MNPFESAINETADKAIQTAEIAKIGLDQSRALELKSAFAEFEAQAKEWSEKARQIIVTDISQKKEMKQAREARLALRSVRIAVAKKHEELKEDAKKTGQFLDLIKRTLTGFIEPTEAYLQEQEDFEAIHAEKIKKELYEKRFAELSQYVPNAELFSLGELDEEVYQSILTGQKLAAEQREKERLEREAKAQADREAKAIEDERVRKENEELKRVQAQKDADFAKERARIQAENKAKEEAAAKERSKSEEKLKKERAERKRLEDEAAERAAKDEAERKAKLAADRKLKRAPDKEKLLSFAIQLDGLKSAEKKLALASEEAIEIMKQTMILIEKTATYIRTRTNDLYP